MFQPSSIEQRVVLICDRPHWAYDAIAQALVQQNHDAALRLEIAYAKGTAALASAVQDADLVFVLGWQVAATWQDSWWARLRDRSGIVESRWTWLEPARALAGLHSHHGWDGRRTTPEADVAPPPGLVEFLRRFRGINAVSRRLSELFRRAGLDVAYTPNGVDETVFRPLAPMAREGPLRVGYSGSLKHDWRKGITEFIQPACELPGIELKLAMPAEDHYVSHAQMPQFYNAIDVYLCASSSEGFSLSVLEAAACGRPIISTRVGGSEELIVGGVNGFLVERRVDAIRDKLRYFVEHRDAVVQMGAQNRRLIEEHWSWRERAPAWLAFIRAGLEARLRERAAPEPTGVR